MGLTTVHTKVSKGKTVCEVDFLVDSGATFTLLPEEVWKKLKLKSIQRLSFSLADATIVERNISEVMMEYKGICRTTQVILGERKDEALLGALHLKQWD